MIKNDIYNYINPVLETVFKQLRESNPYRNPNSYLMGDDLVTLLDQAGVFSDLSRNHRTKLNYIHRAVKNNPELIDIVKFQMPVITKGKTTQPVVYRLMTLAEMKKATDDIEVAENNVVIAVVNARIQEDIARAEEKLRSKVNGDTKQAEVAEEDDARQTKAKVDEYLLNLLRKKGVMKKDIHTTRTKRG